jgi:hypothetical protein
MPTARSGLAAATSPGRLHVLGGNSGYADVLTTHEVYQPANDAWSTAASLPSARFGLAAVTGPDGLIYAIGGTDGTNPLATVGAFTADKCYPIELKIAAVESELSTVQGDLGDLPPQDHAGAEKQIIALGLELKGLEAQLKTCRGG